MTRKRSVSSTSTIRFPDRVSDGRINGAEHEGLRDREIEQRLAYESRHQPFHVHLDIGQLWHLLDHALARPYIASPGPYRSERRASSSVG
jgi:hypothetical protein